MKKRVDYYKTNAAVLKRALKKLGLKSADGNDSPYVYAECPGRFTDEAFCALLSDKAGVIATPDGDFTNKTENFSGSPLSRRERKFSPQATESAV